MSLQVVKKITRSLTAYQTADIDMKVKSCQRIVVDGAFRLGVGEIAILIKDLDGNYVFCTRELLRNLLTYDIGVDFPVFVRVRIKPTVSASVTVWIYG